jgi:hypothetical protein
MYKLKLHSNMMRAFAKLLAIHPLNEKQTKIYNKLNSSKQKLGFLARHMIKCAKKENIPKILIDNYFYTKYLYMYYKNKNVNYKLEIDKHIHNSQIYDKNSQNFLNAVKSFYYKGKKDEFCKINLQNMYKITLLIIYSITEKYNLNF